MPNNFTAAIHESADTVLDLFDRFSKNFPEGLSLSVIKGEFHLTDATTGANYFTGEYAWEVDEYLLTIDNECLCDGAEPVHTCDFPPCVAERKAEDDYWADQFRQAQLATTEGIAAHKHPQRVEDVLDAIDEGRI